MPRHSLVDDARKFALGWRVWFWLIMAVNFFIPIVFVTRIEAQLTLASYAFASVTIVVLHRRLGWVRLLGVGHLPWLALVPWLVHRYTSTGPSGAFATCSDSHRIGPGRPRGTGSAVHRSFSG